MDKKLITFLFLGIFMFSLVSAALYNQPTWLSVSGESLDDVKNKVSDEEYLDYIRSIETNETIGIFTKYFIPNTKTVKIYDDKSKPMLNMTWLTEYEEKVGSGSETEIACARIDYLDTKVLPIFNQTKSYDKKNDFETLDKNFTMKIKRPIIAESCYNKTNNETNITENICYNYNSTELIPIAGLSDIKYFPQEVCWYADTVEGENIEFVIGNGDFWLVEFASYLVTDLISYYKLDENAASTVVADSHGSNTGTSSTNTNNLYDASGIKNSDFDFDYSTGNNNVDLGAALVPATGDFTINLWARTTYTAQEQQVFRQYSGGQDGRMLIHVYHSTGAVSQFTFVGGITLQGTNLSDGDWHMLTVTRSGNDFILYEEGSSVDTGSSSQNIQVSANTDLASDGYHVRSSVDEVGVWSRALNTTEISELYNSGAGLAYPFEPIDTCTYTSGDWNVNCSDDCVISSPVDVGGNDIFIIGTGTFLTSEDIIGYDRLHIKGTDSSNICHVTCAGGCFR